MPLYMDVQQGKVFCLVEAPSAEAAATVHRERTACWPMTFPRC